MKPMLAKKFTGQRVKGWLMSEKLDGVRAIWTGSEFISRNGNRFFAPDWFTSQLPKGIVLDGELYLGRGSFQACVGIVRKKTPVDGDWQRVRYFVFDAPIHPGDFRERLSFCKMLLDGCGVSQVVEHVTCKDGNHLRFFFESVVQAGAEGVMLRNPTSAYDRCRSDNLLKYKPVDSDEAIILEHVRGEGRNTNRLGALVVRWGKLIFKVGAGIPDILRDNPPRIGSTVTFLFSGTTDAGIPRFPVFSTVRNYE